MNWREDRRPGTSRPAPMGTQCDRGARPGPRQQSQAEEEAAAALSASRRPRAEEQWRWWACPSDWGEAGSHAGQQMKQKVGGFLLYEDARGLVL